MTRPSPAAAFTRLHTAAIMLFGMIAGCVNALQPLLLGGLRDLERISTVEIGRTAMAEALGMAITTTLAALLLQPRRLRALALVSITGLVLANVATTAADGTTVMLLRGLHGLCAGILMWILVGFMARSAQPGRLFAIYVSAQAGNCFLLSLLLGHWLIPAFGADGGYLLLMLLDVLLLAAVTVMPPAFTGAGAGSARGWPPASGLVGLLAVACYLAAVMAFWVYLVPLGRQLGYPAGLLNTGVSLAIAMQIGGGLAAAYLSTRMRPLAVCVIGAVLIALAIIAFLVAQGSAAPLLALAGFAFVWMFVPPFQLPLLITVDPTLRSALLIGSAQLVGVACGPLLSSQAVSDGDVRPAATVALACAGLAALLTLLAARLRPARVR